MRTNEDPIGCSSGAGDDERGATFVLTAVCMVALLGGGAMGVDVGFTVDGSRQAQAMADTGALDLARYINVADAVHDTASDSQTYMAGKLANVETDNSGSNATLDGDARHLDRLDMHGADRGQRRLLRPGPDAARCPAPA